ncbi:MAG TPA: hypothetical protein VMI72_16100 [Roseiarcus sp.]|nr:hypothetical protein [Roseiarcus sp.]
MTDGSIAQWMEQSQWVVLATVEAPGSSALASVKASPKTAEIKIDEVLRGPKALADYRGPVTLYSESGEQLQKGQRAIFFTRSWLYGASIAVVEVGRLAETAVAGLRNEIASSNVEDRELSERIRRAELVVLGTVERTEPLSVAGRHRVETEHDPDWWTAYVDVKSTEKGEAPRSPLSVLFANSHDEMWIDAPKLEPGQTLILVLQRNQTEKGWLVLRVPGLTALDPLDVQPEEQLERVRRLIRR